MSENITLIGGPADGQTHVYDGIDTLEVQQLPPEHEPDRPLKPKTYRYRRSTEDPSKFIFWPD